MRIMQNVDLLVCFFLPGRFSGWGGVQLAGWDTICQCVDATPIFRHLSFIKKGNGELVHDPLSLICSGFQLVRIKLSRPHRL